MEGTIASLTWDDCEHCKHLKEDGCEFSNVNDEIELDLILEVVKCGLFEEL